MHQKRPRSFWEYAQHFDSMFQSMAFSSKLHYHTFWWMRLGRMTAMYKKQKNTKDTLFNLRKTSSCDSAKHDESIMRLDSHQQTDFLFPIFSCSHKHTHAHIHSHTRVVSLMRYHFVIYHAAQQDVYPPLMHQRQQQFCPCLCAPSRLQRASAVWRWRRQMRPPHYKWLNSSSLSDPLTETLCVRPRSSIPPPPMAFAWLGVNVHAAERCSKGNSVYTSCLIRHNHSDRLVIKEQFRWCYTVVCHGAGWSSNPFFFSVKSHGHMIHRDTRENIVMLICTLKLNIKVAFTYKNLPLCNIFC